ncbi:MAG: hypothetical protein A3A96_02635 [Candidatus Zambryskibacteria bacterium RIFCSPLOWO2_01_FULL_39_39]|uniref:Ribonuclease n=1 Tax=Candidatus Zambryskibacteria bacterium RIFCSPLOWO2_01_FULL_39_39 TaxID=1802758 RepID=A0A1G2U1C5_9BACT|nr:MAG: hypothetical protein A2644_02350 [Candidatus Zambryskibacteria bacterium RIFCSPHIGHO2_01_FULL_39_63]OHA94855.1 MAG: hypothetical protein A3B88_04395 [Candidatus Zambryskibacteria bacterium RIFCSPHIGHO2_02_FULL_39_19]OHA98345.1 MAG: hypothetical protein A3F20_02085 [Candidatus Zambryskibacteria bacterium RIFCSPHIGHO2_12_FULL_39_21]OHB02720.1 MAG: hypothetical protein A3A96_02635 [Candidatus Zambryskibacteria bacterium RIFCSPLOWO2_01_FULL_39_39]
MQMSKFHNSSIIQSMKFVIGVDEAGRGPLAGPVSVGVFMAPKNLNKKLIKILGGKIRDSKKLSPKRREGIYKQFKELKKSREINFSVSHISNKVIDEIGISKAVQKGIDMSLYNLHSSYDRKNSVIRLDGLLKAPKEFKNQKTIIKGDEKDVFIACASIVAKVSRDRLLCRLGSKYPAYSLEIHKGYGTQLHIKLIKKYGLSPLHRKSFCKNLTK